MELTIQGSMMIQSAIVTHHHNFSWEINTKKSDTQIGVVQSISRFDRIRKHFRNNLAVTDNMSTYEKNLITIDILPENKLVH